MSSRVRTSLLSLDHSFALAGLSGPQPAGGYLLEIEEEDIDGPTLRGTRRTGARLHVPAIELYGPKHRADARRMPPAFPPRPAPAPAGHALAGLHQLRALFQGLFTGGAAGWSGFLQAMPERGTGPYPAPEHLIVPLEAGELDQLLEIAQQGSTRGISREAAAQPGRVPA